MFSAVVYAARASGFLVRLGFVEKFSYGFGDGAPLISLKLSEQGVPRISAWNTSFATRRVQGEKVAP